MIQGPTPIFVLGSPRSGTTLIGNYIGSSPVICNLGEYGGFYLAHAIAPHEYRRVPTPVKDVYLESLKTHAERFAASIVGEQGHDFYCDATPWNLLIAHALSEQFPAARFVLMLRHYRGVIQSLERSYEDGYLWAGATQVERAQLWQQFYSRTSLLPRDRTIAISYDQLCQSPEQVLAAFHCDLERAGVPTDGFDRRQLALSHATNSAHHRPTLGMISRDGSMILDRVAKRFTSTDCVIENEEVLAHVLPTHELLVSTFQDTYGAANSP